MNICFIYFNVLLLKDCIYITLNMMKKIPAIYIVPEI